MTIKSRSLKMKMNNESKKLIHNKPLVSIGMPIRNGGATLEKAIHSIVNQTYSNIEIIISNNCSEDNTDEIIQKYANNDRRIKYYRQSTLISALENFRFVFENAKGKYFLWAAHDDLRNTNYIATLIKGFDKFPAASIVISDVVSFTDPQDLMKIRPLPYNFDTSDLSLLKKLRKSIVTGCNHLYGLINSEYLAEYRWYDVVLGPDRPLLLFLLSRGDFIYMPGTMLYKWEPVSGKNKKQRAIENANSLPLSFPIFRLSWHSTRAVKAAISKNKKSQGHLPFIILFSIIFFFYIMRKNTIKSYIFSMSSRFIRNAWYQWFKKAI